MYKKLKTHFKFEFIALIITGYYYGKKEDTNDNANLIVNLCKRHLGLKNITVNEVRSDLYSCTKFGRIYRYRKIRSSLKRSLFFYLLKKSSLVGGLCLCLSRNKSSGVDLSMYGIKLENMYGGFAYLVKKLTGKDSREILSALEIVESLVLCGLILRSFDFLLKLYSNSDRHPSVFSENSNLLRMLSKKQKFYIRLGIRLYILHSLLEAICGLIFIYLVATQLAVISPFIKIDKVFSWVSYIVDIFLKLLGFKV